MFKKPFSFDGRIRRLEYALSNIIFVGIYTPFLILMNISATSPSIAIVFLIMLIPFYWFMLAQGAKRCHDRGNSGWWQLIPFYGLWMFFGDGQIGPNEYGENPKGLSYKLEGLYRRGDEEDADSDREPNS